MDVKDVVPYVQTFGIITSFLLAAFTTWRSLRTSRVSTYMDLVKSHRDLWMNTLKEKGFENIFSCAPEDWIREISIKEHMFVNFLINHLSCSFELSKVKNVITPEGLERDIIMSFSYPIPRRVWNDSKKFRNQDFVSFVDRILVRANPKIEASKSKNIPEIKEDYTI